MKQLIFGILALLAMLAMGEWEYREQVQVAALENIGR